MYSGKIHNDIFIFVWDGLCHADEPGGSEKPALPELLSAAVAGAGVVRSDSRCADLGRRRFADVCMFRDDFVAVPESTTENVVVVGGRVVRGSDRGGHGFHDTLFQPVASGVDGSEAAGYGQAVCGDQYLCAWHGAADTGAELGGMEAGVADDGIRNLCDGPIFVGDVGVATGDRAEPRGVQAGIQDRVCVVPAVGIGD